MLDKMKQLVREKDTCVLATAADKTPHCSLMAYVTDPQSREIYMVTQRNSTKYQNLMDNPTVSLLIDTRDESRRPHTVAMTVDGVFRHIDDPDKRVSVRARLLERHPHMEPFLDQPDAEIFAIRITSFLLLNGLTDAYFEKV